MSHGHEMGTQSHRPPRAQFHKNKTAFSSVLRLEESVVWAMLAVRWRRRRLMDDEMPLASAATPDGTSISAAALLRMQSIARCYGCSAAIPAPAGDPPIAHLSTKTSHSKCNTRG
jgi:hypothetical protein